MIIDTFQRVDKGTCGRTISTTILPHVPIILALLIVKLTPVLALWNVLVDVLEKFPNLLASEERRFAVQPSSVFIKLDSPL
jgi:hypothetical protein